MGKKYIVEGAVCMCKFGTTPGLLKVLNQKKVHINGNKLVATDLNIGNVFEPPAFTMCKINPMFPKPCVPTVTQWSSPFSKIKINRMASPLIEGSKGTCGSGCPNCIEFMTTGQIELPGAPQMKNATAIIQGDLDPMGESLALSEHQIVSFLKVTIS